jgi:hypothetical protein
VNEELPMTICADYAEVFETEIRPHRRVTRRARRVAAYALWAGLFIIRPRLALEILRERREQA